MTSLQQAMDIAEERAYEKCTPAFPPVTDTIATLKSIDREEMRERVRAGVNNVGLVLAVLGEKIHDLGVFLAKV